MGVPFPFGAWGWVGGGEEEGEAKCAGGGEEGRMTSSCMIIYEIMH